MRVLIVEDDVAVCSLAHKAFEEILSSNGDIQEVTTLERAVEKTENEDWDIILLDLKMSPTTSVENTISYIPILSQHSLVIILTGYDSPEIRRKAKAAGAIGFIAKDASLFQSRFSLAVRVVDALRNWNLPAQRLAENILTLENLVSYKLNSNAPVNTAA